jgi:hypothetical protein
MVAVHVDPLALCPADHIHVASLADFADRLLGRAGGTGTGRPDRARASADPAAPG